MGTFDIGKVGTELATGIGGQILGIALGNYQDKRQLKQQGKLTAQQVKAQKELADYQQQQQLDMWNKTNIKAQVEHYKNAGMNPALMYGMGGGGGVTTGGGIQTGVTGATATDPSSATGTGTQLGMMLAQQDLIKAQAENLRADTTKKLGVDTTKTETEIQNLIANTTNTNAKTTLTNLQTDFQKLENTIKTKTLDKAIARIEWEADDAFEKLQKDSRENNWGEETYKISVDTVFQQYANLIAQKALTEQQTATGKATETAITTENEMNIKRTIANIEQKWQELSGTQKDLKELKNTNEYNMLEGILGTVGATALLQLLTKKPTMIKGYGVKY